MALSNDSAGIFAIAVLRDFALSVGQEAGQILACHLLEEGGDVVEQNLKFARMIAGTLVGAHPWRDGGEENLAQVNLTQAVRYLPKRP